MRRRRGVPPELAVLDAEMRTDARRRRRERALLTVVVAGVFVVVLIPVWSPLFR